MKFEKNIFIYKNIYNLPELIYKEKVSWEFLRFYKKTHYFVIIAIYNPRKEILLVRDFEKNIGWEIPGGGINKNEDIIVDIDNPRHSGILSKIWNNYYRYFLGDCGNYFLSFEKFRKIIKDEAKGLDHKVGLIKTVKGKYFFASLNMPH